MDPSSGTKLEEWERQFAEQLAAKEEQEEKSLAEKKAAAERALDIFYDELTDKKAQKQAQNREHEEQLRSQRVVVVTNSHVFCVIFGLRFSTDTFQNPFERVMELIGPTVSSSGSSETQIMHSLLVRLKQQPPPSRRGDSSSTPSSDKREQPLEESQREEVSSSTTPTTTTLEE